MRVFSSEEVAKMPEVDRIQFKGGLYQPRKCSDDVMLSMVLQIHITDYCNLQCRHCYGRDNRITEMSFEHFKYNIGQYFEFIKRHRLTGMVSLTGGEPFKHSQFDKILTHLYEEYYCMGYPFAVTILTNGVDIPN